MLLPTPVWRRRRWRATARHSLPDRRYRLSHRRRIVAWAADPWKRGTSGGWERARGDRRRRSTSPVGTTPSLGDAPVGMDVASVEGSNRSLALRESMVTGLSLTERLTWLDSMISSAFRPEQNHLQRSRAASQDGTGSRRAGTGPRRGPEPRRAMEPREGTGPSPTRERAAKSDMIDGHRSCADGMTRCASRHPAP